MPTLEENIKAITKIWRNPTDRCLNFFGKAPHFKLDEQTGGIEPYQLGVYLLLWGEIYGNRPDARLIVATGRGTGKTSIWQELCAADIAVFMPYMLQLYYGEKKPIDITIIFTANVKKGSRQRVENVKSFIQNNPYLERHLIDYKSWTKEEVKLKNGTLIRAEVASDRVRGFHSKHPKGKVIYLIDEFAFLGGTACMDGQAFVQEVAEQSFGANIGCFTTPYGKRGGAWWAWNEPTWHKFNFPTRVNPRTDLNALATKVDRLIKQGRQVVVDQEIRGLFVDDAGLFFSMEIWLKSINNSLEWIVPEQDTYHKLVKGLDEIITTNKRVPGKFLLGLDPNLGNKRAGNDPFGVALTEQVGNKYFSRLCVAINGRSHEEMMRIIKPICAIFRPHKINFDGGGGFFTGPLTMLKGSPGVENVQAIQASKNVIVGYMTKLRALMAMGKFEQPPSESLKESQMALGAIGDTEDGDITNIKFQTEGKRFGIPCDIAAMGLTLARENVLADDLAANIVSTPDSLAPHRQLEKARIFSQFDRVSSDIGVNNRIFTLMRRDICRN